MRKHLNQAAVLAILSTLIMSGIGVSYAAWTKQLVVNGTVQTAALDWEFADCGVLDAKYTQQPDYTCNPGFTYDKPHHGYYWLSTGNYAWGNCSIESDYTTALLTLHNAYPGYFNKMDFTAYNGCDDFDLKVTRAIVQQGSNEWIVDHVGQIIKMDFNNDGQYDFELQWKTAFGEIIPPGQGSQDMYFWMHVLDPCPQGQDLQFTISIEAEMINP